MRINGSNYYFEKKEKIMKTTEKIALILMVAFTLSIIYNT